MFCDDTRSLSPLVSIIVPVYNSRDYLHRCLDSLSKQTYKNLEIICINDGSTDDSLDILREHEKKDPRIYLIDKENRGYGNTLNIGLDVARGTYIGILESDDFAEERMYQELVDLAELHGVDVVKSDYYDHWDKQGKIHPKGIFRGMETLTVSVLTPTVHPRLFLMPPSIWSAIYRKDFLDTYGIRFLETPGASYQDTSFNFKVLAKARSIWLQPECLVHYRRDNEQSSILSKEKIFSICVENDEILRCLVPGSESATTILRVANKVFVNSYLWNMNRIPLNAVPGFLQRMKEDVLKRLDSGQWEPSFLSTWERMFIFLLTKSARFAYWFHLLNRSNIIKISTGTYTRVKVLGIRVLKNKSHMDE